MLHVCGSFHCEGGLGIAEMLRHYAPAATQLVVAIYPEEVRAMQPSLGNGRNVTVALRLCALHTTCT